MTFLGCFTITGIKQSNPTVIRKPGLPADSVNRVKSKPVLALTVLERSADEKNISTPDITVEKSKSAIKPGIFLAINEVVSICIYDEKSDSTFYQRIGRTM